MPEIQSGHLGREYFICQCVGFFFPIVNFSCQNIPMVFFDSVLVCQMCEMGFTLVC